MKEKSVILQEIRSAKPGDVKLISFDPSQDQLVRESLATIWGHCGYHYAMNMVNDMAVIALIVKEKDEEHDQEQ